MAVDFLTQMGKGMHLHYLCRTEVEIPPHLIMGVKFKGESEVPWELVLKTLPPTRQFSRVRDCPDHELGLRNMIKVGAGDSGCSREVNLFHLSLRLTRTDP